MLLHELCAISIRVNARILRVREERVRREGEKKMWERRRRRRRKKEQNLL